MASWVLQPRAADLGAGAQNSAQEDRRRPPRWARSKATPSTRAARSALIACRPRAVRRRVGGRGHEWFNEELSERRVSYESAVPEMPAVAVSREPDASINSDDLAGNDAVCSTCPSRPSP